MARSRAGGRGLAFLIEWRADGGQRHNSRERSQPAAPTMATLPPPLIDGEALTVHSNGGTWSIEWHSPVTEPEGTKHGANAFCITGDSHVVLISNDGEQWGWPGGRPEGDESWEQTLRREILEEACATVHGARLLGFCRARCVAGPEHNRVLVRSIWRADVELHVWEARFEIRHRRLVPTDELLVHLWIEEGFEPLYHRVLLEAGILPVTLENR
jgi:ADP-ribose pyrophosphatase YjhB (NUDIX family)